MEWEHLESQTRVSVMQRVVAFCRSVATGVRFIEVVPTAVGGSIMSGFRVSVETKKH